MQIMDDFEVADVVPASALTDEQLAKTVYFIWFTSGKGWTSEESCASENSINGSRTSTTHLHLHRSWWYLNSVWSSHSACKWAFPHLRSLQRSYTQSLTRWWWPNLRLASRGTLFLLNHWCGHSNGQHMGAERHPENGRSSSHRSFRNLGSEDSSQMAMYTFTQYWQSSSWRMRTT